MLEKAMASLKSPSVPAFHMKKVAPGHFIATVEMDCSNMCFHVGETVPVATVEGNVSATEYLAEESAAKQAFEYLARRHLVYLIDYSRMESVKCAHRLPGACINTCLHHVHAALGRFRESIRKVENLFYEIQAKKTVAAREMSPEQLEAYNALGRYLVYVTGPKNEKHDHYQSLIDEYDITAVCAKERHNKRVTDRNLKGGRHGALFSYKDMLHYILEYLRIPPPKYGKEFDDRTFVGHVTIDFPDCEELNCYGTTTFKCYGNSGAKSSEEEAAAKAVGYIETTVNLILVDLNYEHKVAAEGEHNDSVVLLKNLLDLARKIHADMVDLTEYMKAASNKYGIGGEKSCGDGINQVLSFCELKAAGVAANLTEVEKYEDKVN